MKSIESLLRSLFISLFPITALLTTVYAGVHSFKSGSLLEVAGIFIIAFTIVVFFAGLFIKPRARTDVNLKLYSGLIAIGLVINSLIAFLSEPASIFQLMIGLSLTVGWIAYLKWYSVFKSRKSEILKVDKQLVEFKMEDLKKRPISSTSFLGGPSIFLFYRGNWCPLCIAQIKEIAGLYNELDRMGVNTVMISPQPHKHTKTLADKFNLNFHFLVDHKNKVAKQLGIFAPNGIPAGFQVLGYDSDTVMPTVIITDKNGKIIFKDLTDNYRVRPEPEVFLKIIKESTSL